MNCVKCNYTLQEGAIACDKCGQSVSEEKIEFFSIAPWRLAMLSIVTFGLYDIYWFYKHWQAMQKVEPEKKISPAGRALFAIFYCYSLFTKVIARAEKHGYGSFYPAGLLAFFYIILAISSGLLSKIDVASFYVDLLWLVILFVSVLPLLPVQQAINYTNSKIVPNYQLRNKFSTAEIIVIIIGFIFLSLTIVGVFSYFLPE